MTDDKRFARMCNWLRKRQLRLHSFNTAKSQKRKVVCVLVDKQTNKELGRA